MTKSDLLKRLQDMPENAPIILTFPDGGWTNLSGNVAFDGVTISVSPDYSRPFSSDN